MRIIIGIGVPIFIVVIWSLFVAPRATYLLRGVPPVMLSLILLGSGAIALFALGRPDLGWIYSIVLIVNQVLLIIWKQ